MAVNIQTQGCALFILFMSLLDGGAALCLLNLQQVRRCFCRLSEFEEDKSSGCVKAWLHC